MPRGGKTPSRAERRWTRDEGWLLRGGEGSGRERGCGRGSDDGDASDAVVLVNAGVCGGFFRYALVGARAAHPPPIYPTVRACLGTRAHPLSRSRSTCTCFLPSTLCERRVKTAIIAASVVGANTSLRTGMTKSRVRHLSD